LLVSYIANGSIPLNHSNTSVGSPWCCTISSARSLDVALSSHSRASSDEKRYRTPVMDVHHSTGTVGGNDHETVMLRGFSASDMVLPNSSAEGWSAVSATNEVKLLFRVP
jgi:hypothetical protein